MYYTDAVYIVKDFSGELESDSESDRLSWIDIDNLPDIMPTQAEYVQGLLKRSKRKKTNLGVML